MPFSAYTYIYHIKDQAHYSVVGGRGTEGTLKEFPLHSVKECGGHMAVRARSKERRLIL